MPHFYLVSPIVLHLFCCRVAINAVCLSNFSAIEGSELFDRCLLIQPRLKIARSAWLALFYFIY